MHYETTTMKKFFVHTDGGARGNPGPAAIGVVLYDEHKKPVVEYKERIGSATNNIAEYKALIKGLEIAAAYTEGILDCFLDSELLVEQMRGNYAVKAQHLKPLFTEVKQLERQFSQVIYHAVPRENPFHARADRLVNNALDGI